MDSIVRSELFNSLREEYFTSVGGNAFSAIAISAIVIGFTVALLSGMFFLRRPVWFHDDGSNIVGDSTDTATGSEKIATVRSRWNATGKLSVVWAILSASAAAGMCIGFGYIPLAPPVALSVATVSFMAVASGVSDYFLRLVDRHILRVCMLLTYLSGVFVTLFIEAMPYYTFVYTLVLLIICVGFILPFHIGASDIRALFITFSALFPFLHEKGAMYAWFVAIALAFIFVGYKKNWKVSRILTEKQSIPLVPIILLPTSIIGIFIPVLL